MKELQFTITNYIREEVSPLLFKSDIEHLNQSMNIDCLSGRVPSLNKIGTTIRFRFNILDGNDIELFGCLVEKNMFYILESPETDVISMISVLIALVDEIAKHIEDSFSIDLISTVDLIELSKMTIQDLDEKGFYN